MRSDAFWRYIDLLQGEINSQSIELLCERLAAAGPGEIVGFADCLAMALYKLDSPDRADQTVADKASPNSRIAMSDDVFLYCRCAVVGSGRARWLQALAEPTAMAAIWPIFDGEMLLSVAPLAWNRATGKDWSHKPRVSVETGSNTAAWKTINPQLGSRAEPRKNPIIPARTWFAMWAMFDPDLPASQVYLNVTTAYGNAIMSEPAWLQWWSDTKLKHLQIQIWLHDNDSAASNIRISRGKASVDFDVNGSFLHSCYRRQTIERARHDVSEAIKYCTAELGLKDAPSLPQIPAAPSSVDLDGPEKTEGSEEVWPS